MNFNIYPLLDRRTTEYGIAIDANGNSMTISTTDATLDALGIKDFDLTKNFSIDTIDDAISKVSSARSGMGAKSNALEHALGYNSSAAYNATAAKSRIEDLDYPQAVTEQKKEEALLQYSLLMQKKRAEQEQKSVNKMFNTLT